MREVIAKELGFLDQPGPTAPSQFICCWLRGLNDEAHTTATFLSWVCLQGSFSLLLQDLEEKPAAAAAEIVLAFSHPVLRFSCWLPLHSQASTDIPPSPVRHKSTFHCCSTMELILLSPAPALRSPHCSPDRFPDHFMPLPAHSLWLQTPPLENQSRHPSALVENSLLKPRSGSPASCKGQGSCPDHRPCSFPLVPSIHFHPI